MDASRRLPLKDYGLIGNCRTAALVSREGSIAWCCFPRFDSESFFASILDDEKGGDFSIRPDLPFRSSQRYVENTNLLVTEFVTDTGRMRITDFFFVTSEERKRGRLLPDQEILRMMECTEGEVAIVAEIRPRAHYGRTALKPRVRGQWGLEFECHNGILLFQSSLRPSPFHLMEHGAHARFQLQAGQKAQMHLLFTDVAPAVIPPLGEAAEARMRETEEYWRTWAERAKYQGEHREIVVRSALALRLMCYAPSGAFIAAPTMSLPEEFGGERNWDYRYAWLRDASFSVRALVALGYEEEAKAYANWLMHTTRLTRPKLQTMYTIYGRTELTEEKLPWLRGYAEARPVRRGNAAYAQFQLDVYGEVLDAIYTVSALYDRLDRATQRFVIDTAHEVCKLWREPDEGIWEVRSGRAHHVHSKALAWVALDRAAKICEKFGIACDASCLQQRDEIGAAIEAQGYDEKLGSYIRAFERPEMDASVLMLPFTGYCLASSPRMQSTLRAVEKHLTRNGYVYRYRDMTDGVVGSEGAFGICNFWLAGCHYSAGNLAEGDRWVKPMLDCLGPLGLWAEEVNPDTRELLGNYPQAFTHLGLIHSLIRRRGLVGRLAREEKEKVSA